MESVQEKKQGGRVRFLLRAVSPDDEAVEVVCRHAPIAIGRSFDAQIRIDDENVSRRHCLIIPSPGRLVLLDQGSANGTLVNGVRARQQRLAQGDVIEVGQTRIHVLLERSGSAQVSGYASSRVENQTRIHSLHPGERFAVVQSFCSRLRHVEDPVVGAEFLIETVLSFCPSDCAYVLIRDTEGKQETVEVLASRAAKGWSERGLDPSRNIIEGVVSAGSAEYHQRFILGTDVEAPFPPERSVPETGMVTHVVCAPIHAGRKFVGAVYLESTEKPEWVATRTMVELLELLAGIAGPTLVRETSSTDLDPKERCSRDGANEGRVHEPSGDRTGVFTIGKVRREAGIIDGASCIDEPGEQIGIVPVGNREVELEARVAELEHLSHTRAQMASWLVHDIKNLTSALEANHYCVRNTLEKNGLDTEAVESAMSCSRQIFSMAMSVLEVQRIEDGGRTLHNEKFDLNDVVSDCGKRFRGVAESERVTIHTPDTKKKCLVIADREVICRVLENLLDNALRHAGRGGWMRIGTKRTASSVRLEVADSGPGVPKTERNSVFDEWFQGQRSEDRSFGIGLCFCRVAAEAHGGSIEIEEVGGRSQFVVELPAAVVAGSDTQTNIPIQSKKRARRKCVSESPGGW